MSGDNCQTCQQEKVNCQCESNQDNSSKSFSLSSIKPPDLFLSKDDLPQYERKLKRWSRACGIPHEQQGDVILIHPSQTNPSLQDRLDREIGDQLQDNKDGIDLILKTLKQWFGINKGVDLMKVFNEFVNNQRKAGQDLHSYVAEFEARYNQLEKLGEKLSPRLLALFLLKHANLSDTEFQIITANLNFSSEKVDEVNKLLEETKEALNKHQNCQAINSKVNSNNKSFFLSSSELDSLTEDQTNELVLWLKKKQKFNSSDQTTSEEQPPAKKWRKCRHCLCDCLPKWKKCEFPCSQHPPWKCPKNPDKQKQDEAAGSNKTNLTNLSSYLSGD